MGSDENRVIERLTKEKNILFNYIERLTNAHETLEHEIKTRDDRLSEFIQRLAHDNCLLSGIHTPIAASLAFDHYREPSGLVFRDDSVRKYGEFHSGSLKECDELTSVSRADPKQWYDSRVPDSSRLRDFLRKQKAIRKEEAMGSGQPTRKKMTRWVIARFDQPREFLKAQMPEIGKFVAEHEQALIDTWIINETKLLPRQMIDFALFVKNDQVGKPQRWVINCSNFHELLTHEAGTLDVSIELADKKKGVEYFEVLIDDYEDRPEEEKIHLVQVNSDFTTIRHPLLYETISG